MAIYKAKLLPSDAYTYFKYTSTRRWELHLIPWHYPIIKQPQLTPCVVFSPAFHVSSALFSMPGFPLDCLHLPCRTFIVSDNRSDLSFTPFKKGLVLFILRSPKHCQCSPNLCSPITQKLAPLIIRESLKLFLFFAGPNYPTKKACR